jgi:transcriptional regulator with XRE-family HTH domain
VTGAAGTEAGDRPDEAAFMRALGKRVRLLRLVRELTQDELAKAAGMSRSFVSLIEHGARGVDVVRLLRLAAGVRRAADRAARRHKYGCRPHR